MLKKSTCDVSFPSSRFFFTISLSLLNISLKVHFQTRIMTALFSIVEQQ